MEYSHEERVTCVLPSGGTVEPCCLLNCCRDMVWFCRNVTGPTVSNATFQTAVQASSLGLSQGPKIAQSIAANEAEAPLPILRANPGPTPAPASSTGDQKHPSPGSSPHLLATTVNLHPQPSPIMKCKLSSREA